MPKKPMDYSKTIIYKLVCKDVNITDLYVGHTTDFIRRKAKHKYGCNTPTSNKYNYNVYQFIRANGGWDNWDMIEIEKYNCNDLNEACKRERYWIETLKATLNKQVPSRKMKEWCEDNKNTLLQYQKKYREENKNKILNYHKEYHRINKNKLLDYNKEYYEKNKELLKEKDKIKKHCDICDCDVNKGLFKRHTKTVKHQENLKK